jgi:hypothetical protein
MPQPSTFPALDLDELLENRTCARRTGLGVVLAVMVEAVVLALMLVVGIVRPKDNMTIQGLAPEVLGVKLPVSGGDVAAPECSIAGAA